MGFMTARYSGPDGGVALHIELDLTPWIEATGLLKRQIGGPVKDFLVMSAQELLEQCKGKLQAPSPPGHALENPVTGDLIGSGFVKISRGKKGFVGFVISIGFSAPYAWSVHAGTAPHVPSFAEIYEWKVKKYGILEIGEGKKVTFQGKSYDKTSPAFNHSIMVWKKIIAKGTYPHPFLDPILDVSNVRTVLRTHIGKLRGELEDLISEITLRTKRARGKHGFRIFSKIRSLGYLVGRISGDLEALGLDMGGIRASVYSSAKMMGDVGSLSSGRIMHRLESRAAGRFTTAGLGSIVKREIGSVKVDPVTRRLMRRGSGRFTGHGIRKILGR